jgi:hypothetical protein
MSTMKARNDAYDIMLLIYEGILTPILPGTIPGQGYRRGWLCGHRARKIVSPKWLRPLRHGGQRLAMVQRLVSPRLL